MNCSSASQRRLRRLLVQLWRELLRGEPGAESGSAPSNSSLRRRPAGAEPSSSGPPPCWAWEEEAASGGHPGKGPAGGGGDDAYLYILLIMIFYGCLAGGLILAYTRSRKLESKHDPYHLYIERDWTGRPGDGGGESGKAAAMAMAPLLREPSLDEVAAVAAAAMGPGERRSSGDGEPL